MGLEKVVVFLLVLSCIVGIADSPTLGIEIEEPVSVGSCVAVSVGLLVCLLAAVRCGGRGTL